ncbi:MAG: hypothetical protein NTZ83_04320 [Candidatus Pacearchaeota archaeon]|nr:hypothetical protein [Candidatus Pacearchaeota archaeon]
MTTIKDTTQEYKPARKEVFNELGNEVKTSSKKAWNCLKRNVGDFIETQKIIYTFPSLFEGKQKYGKLTFGDGLGMIADMGQLVFYMGNIIDAIEPDNLFGFNHNYWLIPVATNVASGIYEAGRKIYKNTEKKLIENHNKGLEGEVKN